MFADVTVFFSKTLPGIRLFAKIRKKTSIGVKLNV